MLEIELIPSSECDTAGWAAKIAEINATARRARQKEWGYDEMAKAVNAVAEKMEPK